jgi:CRP-like cAMP-binding protein
MLFQSVPVENRLLAHLPADAFDALRPHLRRVQLKRQDVLQEPHRPISKVYFLERGMAIMFADSKRDGRVEVGMVGRFGLVGVPAVLGTRVSTHRCVVEVAGNALQVASRELRRSMDEHPVLRQVLMNYIQALLIQNTQTVLCNARHELAERLARWLLLAHDRLAENVIPLTHELFSMMLGVRRAGITDALAQLEQASAVRKRRGAVEIVNRAALERRACECYGIISAEYQRLLNPRGQDEFLPNLRVVAGGN